MRGRSPGLVIAAACVLHVLNSGLFARGQDFISLSQDVDPARARVTLAARHLAAAASDEWGGLSTLPLHPPAEVDLSVVVPGDASATVVCHPGGSAHLVFRTSAPLPEPRLALILPDFFNSILYMCSEAGSSRGEKPCLPQADGAVLSAFMDAAPEVQELLAACTANGTALSLVTATGSGDAGALAAVAALWASQAYPSAAAALVTFASPWAHTRVDQAFLQVLGKAVAFSRSMQQPYEHFSGARAVISTENADVLQPCATGTVVCKVAPYVDAACALYERPRVFEERFPGALVLASGDARAAIMWLDSTRTAVFLFANVADLGGGWSGAAGSGGIMPLFSDELMGSGRDVWGGAEALYAQQLDAAPFISQPFAGALAGLQAAASSEQGGCRGLLECFNLLSARAQPALVVVAGHGLGGAYATAAAPWAAAAFPGAAVQAVTAGAPADIGNQAFYQVFRSLVGLPYQVVNGRDPVPRFPGCRTGARLRLPGGMFINKRVLSMQTDDPLHDSDFADCGDAPTALQDQSCAAYRAALARVKTVAVAIGDPKTAIANGTTNELVLPRTAR